MEIKVGDEWLRATLERVVEVGQTHGTLTVKNPRVVRVVAVETCFVCVEEISLPTHPEYGHPRKWVPRGAFPGDIVLTGGAT